MPSVWGCYKGPVVSMRNPGGAVVFLVVTLSNVFAGTIRLETTCFNATGSPEACSDSNRHTEGFVPMSECNTARATSDDTTSHCHPESGSTTGSIVCAPDGYSKEDILLATSSLHDVDNHNLGSQDHRCVSCPAGYAPGRLNFESYQWDTDDRPYAASNLLRCGTNDYQDYTFAGKTYSPTMSFTPLAVVQCMPGSSNGKVHCVTSGLKVSPADPVSGGIYLIMCSFMKHVMCTTTGNSTKCFTEKQATLMHTCHHMLLIILTQS